MRPSVRITTAMRDSISTINSKSFGSSSVAVGKRLQKLGIQDFFENTSSKSTVLTSLSQKLNLQPEEVMFMGDDIPDYEVMCKVGFPSAPNNACEEIKSISAYISPFTGGNGCVRDVIEQVLKAQDKIHETEIGKYQVISKAEYYEGYLDMNSRKSGYFVCDELEEDVYVPKQNINFTRIYCRC